MKDQKIILTGAAGGIGKATLKQLLQQGAQVYISCTTLQKKEKLLSEMADENYPGTIAGCFIGDLSDTNTFIEDAEKCLGGIDSFIHVAGITKDNLIVRMTQDEWDQVIKINLTTAFQLTKKCLSFMMRKRYGRIVLVTSIVGTIGNIGQANYIASKSGLTGFAKGVAHEMARYGITINCVEPGFIDTDMVNTIPEAIKTKMLENIPLKRMGQPEEIAHGVLFLAHPNASYITGTSLRINGGMFMA